jgi:hypothetical protein
MSHLRDRADTATTAVLLTIRTWLDDDELRARLIAVLRDELHDALREIIADVYCRRDESDDEDN